MQRDVLLLHNAPLPREVKDQMNREFLELTQRPDTTQCSYSAGKEQCEREELV